jgi:hypothetical protein
VCRYLCLNACLAVPSAVSVSPGFAGRVIGLEQAVISWQAHVPCALWQAPYLSHIGDTRARLRLGLVAGDSVLSLPEGCSLSLQVEGLMVCDSKT